MALPLLFGLIVVFLCNPVGVLVQGGGGRDKPYHVVPVSSMEPKPNCTPSTRDKGSSLRSEKLKVINIHGPCSPTSHGKTSTYPGKTFIHDKTRVEFINGRGPQFDPLHPEKEESRGGGANLPASDRSTGENNYAVTVGFGTPKRDYTLIFDTGSDTTWIQCKPCPSCYNQTQPIFDPSLSSTYQNGSCKSSYFDQNTYYQPYGDGSYSSGFLGCDTLSLEPTDVIRNFEFGCGQDNSPGFGKAAGMLGLGQGDRSLISQTASVFGKSFSYCLPTSPSSTGYLLFGNHVNSSHYRYPYLKYTALLPNPSGFPSYYFVQLNGITVGTTRLNVSSALFSLPGTIIDSGTVITRLPKVVYKALRSAFQKSMSMYPSAPPVEILDTCYDFSHYEEVRYPSIVFHFGKNVNVNLDPTGIVWRASISQVCLAFAAKGQAGDVNIIGNTQQQGLHVFYDLKGKRIGFGPNGCHGPDRKFPRIRD
ncbi:Nepenthesin [Bertholletia excelsa]